MLSLEITGEPFKVKARLQTQQKVNGKFREEAKDIEELVN